MMWPFKSSIEPEKVKDDYNTLSEKEAEIVEIFRSKLPCPVNLIFFLT